MGRIQNETRFEAANSDDGFVQIQDFAGSLWRARSLILASAAICCSLGAIYSISFATPTYKSQAFVVLETREESYVELDGLIGGLAKDSSAIKTEVEVLKSQGLAGRVARRLNLAADPEFNESLRPQEYWEGLLALLTAKLPINIQTSGPQKTEVQIGAEIADELLNSVSIQNVSGSLVFQISASSQSAEKSALIANAFAETYVQDQIDTKHAATRKATRWLTERVAELKADLEQSREAVRAFQIDTELVDSETLADMDRRLKEVRGRIAEAQEKQSKDLAYLESLSAKESPAEVAAASSDTALQQIVREAGSELGPRERSRFQLRLDQLRERTNLLLNRARAEILALEAAETDLREDIEKQSDDLIFLEQLERESEASRLLYEHFLGRLKETAAQEGLQRADSRILTLAVAPTTPATPRIHLVLGMAGVFGFLLGSAVVLKKAASKASAFRTAQELEKATGKPVFGKVPLIRSRRRSAYVKYLRKHPVSAIAEAFRDLRTSLLMSRPSGPVRVVVVSSSVPGEGKSAISAALAFKMAELGKKVLLIDADLRRSGLSKYITLPKGGASLNSVLTESADWQEAVRPEIAKNLDYIPSGCSMSDAADKFSGTAFASMIREAETMYDLIIIDTPPVLLVTDARVIATCADSVLFAVRWNSTTRDQVLEGISRFQGIGQDVSGLVLSGIDTKEMRRYGYGAEYGVYGRSYFKH